MEESAPKPSCLNRLKYQIRDFRIRICHLIIKKAVRQLDVLHYGAFLVYSWGFDNETDYHVIKERSTMEFHQYGTTVTYYDQEEKHA